MREWVLDKGSLEPLSPAAKRDEGSAAAAFLAHQNVVKGVADIVEHGLHLSLCAPLQHIPPESSLLPSTEPAFLTCLSSRLVSVTLPPQQITAQKMTLNENDATTS